MKTLSRGPRSCCVCSRFFALLPFFLFLSSFSARCRDDEQQAEVVTVCIVVVIVGAQAMLRRNIFLWQGLLVLSLYPLSILLIYTLQSFGIK